MDSLTLQLKRETSAFARISVSLDRFGFRVFDQEALVTEDPRLRGLRLVLTGDGDLPSLLAELSALECVATVRHERLSDLDSTTLSRASSIALTIANAYPDVVRYVKDFSVSLDPSLRSLALADLGEKVGGLLLRKGIVSRRSGKSLTRLLGAEVVDVVSSFAIVEAEEHRLIVLACPFCRDIRGDQPCCHFLTGLIRSLMSGLLEQPGIQVDEITCKATGEATCTFEVRV